MKLKLLRSAPFLLLLGGTAILFLAYLGRLPLLGRDEALYAESGREMFASGDWITPRVNAEPFFEKPPLYYWLAAISYRAFGVSPFAARLPAALMAILIILLTVRLGQRVWGGRAGILAGLALATSLQIAMIGRMGIMDVPLACLTLIALLYYEKWYQPHPPAPSPPAERGELTAAGFGACVGLAILLKGAAGLIPIGVVAVDQVIMLFSRSIRLRISFRSLGLALIAIIVCIGIAAPWFIIMSQRHGETFRNTLFLHEHIKRIAHPMQGHGGPIWYYLPLLIISFFPWWAFLPTAALHREADDRAIFWRRLSLVWIAAVFVPFSLIQTKLPGYITPLFPAMALLVGAEMDRRLRQPGRAPWIAMIVGAVLLAGVASLLPVMGARIGERVGASQEAQKLVLPVGIWIFGYLVIIVGAALALMKRAVTGIGFIMIGQIIVIAALLLGVLPVLSPYLGGGEYRLAEIARRELPQNEVVLYETRPEAVVFVLGKPVETFGAAEQAELLAYLRDRDVALLAPAKERAFLSQFRVKRLWKSGDRVLLEIANLTE